MSGLSLAWVQIVQSLTWASLDAVQKWAALLKYLRSFPIFTVHKGVAKVMLLQASVCSRGEGVSASVHGGIPQHPGADPLGTRHSPPGADTTWDQTHPPWTRHPPEQTPQGPDTHPPGPDTPWTIHSTQTHTPQTRHTPPGTRHPPPGADTPPPRDGHCCGRYASYWNALLF